MASGNPKFGGTNGVTALDIGQPGGTRETAADALFSGNVIVGPDEVPTVETSPPQENVTYRDVLGFEGKRVVWEGTIFAKDAATLRTILSEIGQKKHGALRDASTGNLLAPNPAMIKETQLTDSDGTVLSNKAVLEDWYQRGRLFKGAQWPVIMRVSIEFRILG